VFSFASTQGSVSIRSQATAFFDAFVRRIESGLLGPASGRRNRYGVTRRAADGLVFRAVNGWTAYNIGLNEVDFSLAPPGTIRYQVRYPRWAGYVVGVSAFLGGLLAVVFVVIDIRTYIATHRFSQIPGLTVEQNLAVAWGLAVFFFIVWPWILIALHKGPLRRALEQVIREVDAAAKA